MFPLTEDKLLLKFLGRSLLEHQVDKVVQAGLRDFVIIANPLNRDRIQAIFDRLSGVSAQLVVQDEPLGIADALVRARPYLDGETLIVNPNDVFDGAAYGRLLEARGPVGPAAHILGYRVKEYFPGGYLVVDADGRLTKIVEKPGAGNEPSDLVNILLHLHTDTGLLFEKVSQVQTSNDDVYECALDLMAKSGAAVKVVPYEGYWSAIKYPWHIFAAIKYFIDRSKPYIAESAQISPRATVEGQVIIEDGVKVLEGAVIRGPAYVGRNSIIGNNALVRGYSHIGSGCVVGYCTEIKGSYVGDDCWFHSTYAGDAIIADNCSFGAGTVLANFRFDERNMSLRVGNESVDTGLDKLGAMIGENSKTGINAGILPGVRVGSNTFVGPHVCLTADVEPNKIVLPEARYNVVRNMISVDDGKKDQLRERLK